MKRIIKKGFGYLIILLIMLGITLSPMIVIDKQLQESEQQEEVPLQNAVDSNKLIAKIKVKKVKKKVKKVKRKIKKVYKKVVKKKNKKVVKVSGTKAQYQAYAHDLVINTYHWSEYDFKCLVKLWNRESGWSASAHNKTSGAHGIPQSLPASKMKSEGADYYTNGYTQIRWGLKYIKNRYGSPSKAWQHSQRKGWY